MTLEVICLISFCALLLTMEVMCVPGVFLVHVEQ